MPNGETFLFATRLDYEPLFRRFEERERLQYVRCDLSESPKLTVYRSAFDLPDLGRALTGGI